MADKDVISTIIAEALGDGEEGMTAVAYVIANRAAKRQMTPTEVVRQEGQFAGYSSPGADVKRAQSDPAVVRQVTRIWESVKAGKVPDPTSGGTMFHASRVTPEWAAAENKHGTVKVGGQTFYKGAVSLPKVDVPQFTVGDLSAQGAKLAEGTLKGVQGLVVHHTGPGMKTAQDVIGVLEGRGYGVTYVMDRSGAVYRVVPEGSRTEHVGMRNRRSSDFDAFSNSNLEGIEIIAANDGDISPAQARSFQTFAAWHVNRYSYDPNMVVAHGDISSNKQMTEGHTAVYAFRTFSGLPLPEKPLVGTEGKEVLFSYAGVTGKQSPFVSAVEAARQLSEAKAAPVPAPRERIEALRQGLANKSASISIPRRDPRSVPATKTPKARIAAAREEMRIQRNQAATRERVARNNQAFGITDGEVTARVAPGLVDDQVFLSTGVPDPGSDFIQFDEANRMNQQGLGALLGKAFPLTVANPELPAPQGPVPATQSAALAAARTAQPDAPVPPPRRDPRGLVEAGNIDLNNRQVVRNEDGSISTEKSVSFNIDGVEVLIPTVFDGAHHSEEEAIRHYEQTGEHLGKFTSPAAADAYANKLHDRQDAFYNAAQAPVPGPRLDPQTESEPAPAAKKPTATAVLPSGKTVEIGRTYSFGGQTYVGGVDEKGVGTLNKVNIGVLSEAGKPTMVGKIVDAEIKKAVASGVEQVGPAAQVAAAAVGAVASDVAGRVGNLFGNLFGGQAEPASTRKLLTTDRSGNRALIDVPSTFPARPSVIPSNRTARSRVAAAKAVATRAASLPESSGSGSERRGMLSAENAIKAQRAAVTGLGKTVAQIGQEADNARYSGYREIQEMGPARPIPPAIPSAQAVQQRVTIAPRAKPVLSAPGAGLTAAQKAAFGGYSAPNAVKEMAPLSAPGADLTAAQKAAFGGYTPSKPIKPAKVTTQTVAPQPMPNLRGADRTPKLAVTKQAQPVSMVPKTGYEKPQARVATPRTILPAKPPTPTFVSATGQSLTPTQVRQYNPDTGTFETKTVYRAPSTAGAKLSEPRTEGTNVFGAENAFQPRAVQESVRFQTGY